MHCGGLLCFVQQARVPLRILSDLIFVLKNDDGRHLRKGKHKIQLWPIKENDESLDYVAPGKISVHDDELWRIEKVTCVRTPQNSHAYIIHPFKLVQEYKRGKIPRVDWLDQITFKQIAERINAQVISLPFRTVKSYTDASFDNSL